MRFSKNVWHLNVMPGPWVPPEGPLISYRIGVLFTRDTVFIPYRIGVLFTRKRFAVCCGGFTFVLPPTAQAYHLLWPKILTPYWVDTGFDRLHDIGFVSCHFQSVFIWKRENGMKHIGLVRSRVNRRPIRYEMKTVSCKQKANPIWNQSDMKWKRHRVNGASISASYVL